MTQRFILNLTVILMVALIITPYAVKAENEQPTDFGLLVLAELKEDSVINYYDSIFKSEANNKNYFINSTDNNFLKSLQPVSIKITKWEPWIKERHCTYQKTESSQKFLVVHANKLSNWEKIIKRDIDRDKSIIPLDKLFIALWIDKHSFFNSIGPYFDEQRNWYNSQKQYFESVGSEGTEKLNEINTSIIGTTKNVDYWIKYLVFGLIGCLALGFIGFITLVVFLFMTSRSIRQEEQKEDPEFSKSFYEQQEQLPAEQLNPQPELIEEQPRQTTEEYFNELTEAIIQQFIPHIEGLSEGVKQYQDDKYTQIDNSLRDIRSTLDKYFLVGDDNLPGFQSVNKNLRFIINQLKKGAERTSLPRRKYDS